MAGFCNLVEWSPDARFEGFRGEIVESLRQFIEIFPFSGDGDRRLGSIYTAWPELAVKLAKFSALAGGELGMPSLQRTR
jgi:hypothetical protein